MKEQRIAEWKQLSRPERDALFLKAAKKHKWVHALTLQNMALHDEVTRLKRRVKELERMHDTHTHVPLRDLMASLLPVPEHGE